MQPFFTQAPTPHPLLVLSPALPPPPQIGPSQIALRDCAYGLARYAAIAQHAGLVPIVEPEVLLDGDQDIDRCLEVQEAIWAETFKYMADNKVMLEGILLKPAMVTPGGLLLV